MTAQETHKTTPDTGATASKASPNGSPKPADVLVTNHDPVSTPEDSSVTISARPWLIARLALGVAAGLLAAWFVGAFLGLVSFAPLGFQPITAAPTEAAQTSEPSAERLATLLPTLLEELVVEDSIADGDDAAATALGVDYARVASSTALEEAAWLLAQVGPSSTPEAYATEDARLAYYINAYNVLALLGVKRALPISSVQDVRGWVRLRPGFGFFYGYHFTLDGRHSNLYDLEHDVLRDGFGDARVHAAINCASRSCPSLSPTPYVAATLDAQLDDATSSWLERPDALRIDDEAEAIYVNAIFSWYRDDFLAELDDEDSASTDEAVGNGLLRWIRRYVPTERAAELSAAEASGYAIETMPYDWALNRAE